MNQQRAAHAPHPAKHSDARTQQLNGRPNGPHQHREQRDRDEQVAAPAKLRVDDDQQRRGRKRQPCCPATDTRTRSDGQPAAGGRCMY